jgi:hypothetical protein
MQLAAPIAVDVAPLASVLAHVRGSCQSKLADLTGEPLVATCVHERLEPVIVDIAAKVTGSRPIYEPVQSKTRS